MTKFFKGIRRSLFVGGGFRRYFLYAIGEIVLVVLGILIAVQINNYNEYRKDRVLEREYLTRLRGDIKFDIGWITENILNRYERKMKGLDEGKAYYRGDYVVKDTLQFLVDIGYGGVYGNADWPLNRNTYNEIMSTGNLIKIENDTLRAMINNYYEAVEGYGESSKNYISGYINYINSMRSFNANDPNNMTDFDQKFLLNHMKSEEFYRLANLETTLGYRINDWALIMVKLGNDLLTNIDHALEH